MVNHNPVFNRIKVHSLISAMSRYTGTKIVLVSPEELKLPSYVKKEVLQKNGIPYEQTTDLEPVMPELDILYMTRVQRERFFNEEDYLRLKDSYILTPAFLIESIVISFLPPYHAIPSSFIISAMRIYRP